VPQRRLQPAQTMGERGHRLSFEPINFCSKCHALLKGKSHECLPPPQSRTNPSDREGKRSEETHSPPPLQNKRQPQETDKIASLNDNNLVDLSSSNCEEVQKAPDEKELTQA